ncbi:MAG: phosphoribosylamine--glycine ligase [Candidatus Methylacidiphilales bacterium]|nr:phosphoribosylamine--glycine ligase [Candidatus Methylacidiphilales bacterium]
MKILIIGNGGREHTLGWALHRDPRVTSLHFAPGNAGTASLGSNLPLNATDLDGIESWCGREKPALVVVGPEAPLCLGLVDRLKRLGVPAFGPTADGARLEGSKTFTKDILVEAGIPTADSARFTDSAAAKAHCLAHTQWPLVIKADGLAAGKGVIIARDAQEAVAAVATIMDDRAFGDSGNEVLIEEFLDGEEASIHAVTDGRDYVLLPSSQDHKRVGEGDTGPNTGGMGAYAPAPVVTPALLAEVERTVFQPLLKTLRARGIDYRGVLYGGLMLTSRGPKVLEFNARFGDPETEVLIPLLETPLLDLLLATVEGRLGQLDLRLKSGSALTVVLSAPGYPEKPLTGQPITGLDHPLPPEAAVFHAGTMLKDGRIITSGGRVLAITATAPDLASARTLAYQVVNYIHFDGAHFRRDIAHRALKPASSSSRPSFSYTPAPAP